MNASKEDKRLQYQEILKGGLEDIKRQLTSKKEIEVGEKVEEALGVLEKKGVQWGVGWVEVMRACVQGENKIVMESVLSLSQKMLQNELVAEQKDNRLSEQLLSVLSLCANDSSESVLRLVLNVIMALFNNVNVYLHRQSMAKVFKLLLHIQVICKNGHLVSQMKKVTQEITKYIFSNIEESQMSGGQAEESTQYLLNNYVRNSLTSLVDEVEIFSAREAKGGKDTPLRVVPLPGKQSTELLHIQIENENGEISGKFGWCFVCRRQANLYCKDTRVPLCSPDCKKRHMDELNAVNYKMKQYSMRGELLADGLTVLRTLVKLAAQKEDKKEVVQYVLKNKVIATELLMLILDTPGRQLLGTPEVLHLIQKEVFPCLLTNSQHQDSAIQAVSVQAIGPLAIHFRAHLRKEMISFMDAVVLKVLQSNFAPFPQRMACLGVLCRCVADAQLCLDWFLNYDQAPLVEKSNLLEEMLDLLGKVSQGRYSRKEYNIVTPAQEVTLRTAALQASVDFLGSLDSLTQAAVEDSFPKEEGKALKEQIAEAVRKFNMKPKQGLKLLEEGGLVQQGDAASMVDFIYKQHANLDKDKLGEFIASADPYNNLVLELFTARLSFRGMNIDEALRHYLAQFMLPGEGQQIDRIVQQFGKKYHEDCGESNRFVASGDAAYSLSYLLITLQTYLYNPQVPAKMNVQEFINLGKGINDEKDFDPEFMTGLYNSIEKEPLALHQSEQHKRVLAEALSTGQKRKGELFWGQVQRMAARFAPLQKESPWVKGDSLSQMRQMTESIWTGLLATVSVALEQEQQSNMVQLALQGFFLQVKVMGHLGLETAQEAAMVSIAKFTNLRSLKDVKYKNIKAVETVMQIGLGVQNGLGRQWKYVLETLSRLEQIVMMVQVQQDIFNKNKRYADYQELSSIEAIVKHVDQTQADKIFNASTYLDTANILHMVRALREVSQQELTDNRTFSLQKLVEVADFNLDRIHPVWTQIWDIIQKHLCTAGTIANQQIAIYVIDSLRQLSIKYLSKDEPDREDYQKAFLRPFESILIELGQQKEDSAVKEFLMDCVNMIVQRNFFQLRSGWKVVLNVVNVALNEDNARLQQVAFSILDQVMSHQNHLPTLFHVLVELIQALNKLTKVANEDIAVKSIDYLSTTLRFLVARVELLRQDPSAQAQLQEHQKSLDSLWIPILSSLTSMFSENRYRIQEKSCQVIFSILRENGAHFDKELWRIVFRAVIKNLFDEIQYLFQQYLANIQEENELVVKIKQTCEGAFEELTALIGEHFEAIQEVLSSVFEIVVSCVQNKDDSLAKMSMHCLRQILLQNGSLFHPSHWSLAVSTFQNIFRLTQPNELLHYTSAPGHSIHRDKCITQCTVQLLSIEAIKDIGDNFHSCLAPEHVTALLTLLKDNYTLTHAFNRNISLRHCLWVDGFNSGKQLPGLRKHEKEALSSYCTLLFNVFSQSEGQQRAAFLDSFLNQSEEIFRQFVQNQEQLSQQEGSGGDSEEEELRRIGEHELQLESFRLRQVIEEVVVPSLGQVEAAELGSRMESLVEGLLDVTAFLCQGHEQAVTQLHQMSGGLQRQVKALVMKGVRRG